MRAETQRLDVRDRRWANVLIAIADVMMEDGRDRHALACWELADAVALGGSLDTMLRRVYSVPFAAAIKRESRLLASLMGTR